MRDSTNNWPVTNPVLAGPKCLLINHLVVSVGENFAYDFRRLGLGNLVGMRTGAVEAVKLTFGKVGHMVRRKANWYLELV